jgi:dCTP deaminase
MILAKSAIRQAVFDGRIKILDDDGAPFPGWEVASELHRVEWRTGFISGDPEALQPASIDLSLGRHWMVPKPNAVHKAWDMSVWERTFTPVYRMPQDMPYLDTALPIEYHEAVSDSVVIPAHGFVLVRTAEVLHLDSSLFGKVDGRSSFGRAGLFAETAGIIDPGFQGSITLEVVNALPYPVKLYAGTRCCQITLHTMEGSTEEGYTGQYQGQIATKGSGLWKSVPKA